jgi:hypothetical protein
MHQRWQLVHGVALPYAGEFPDGFVHVAGVSSRQDFQHIGQGELEFAVGGHSLREAEITSQRQRVLP